MKKIIKIFLLFLPIIFWLLFLFWLLSIIIIIIIIIATIFSSVRIPFYYNITNTYLNIPYVYLKETKPNKNSTEDDNYFVYIKNNYNEDNYTLENNFLSNIYFYKQFQDNQFLKNFFLPIIILKNLNVKVKNWEVYLVNKDDIKNIWFYYDIENWKFSYNNAFLQFSSLLNNEYEYLKKYKNNLPTIDLYLNINDDDKYKILYDKVKVEIRWFWIDTDDEGRLLFYFKMKDNLKNSYIKYKIKKYCSIFKEKNKKCQLDNYFKEFLKNIKYKKWYFIFKNIDNWKFWLDNPYFYIKWDKIYVNFQIQLLSISQILKNVDKNWLPVYDVSIEEENNKNKNNKETNENLEIKDFYDILSKKNINNKIISELFKFFDKEKYKNIDLWNNDLKLAILFQNYYVFDKYYDYFKENNVDLYAWKKLSYWWNKKYKIWFDYLEYIKSNENKYNFEVKNLLVSLKELEKALWNKFIINPKLKTIENNLVNYYLNKFWYNSIDSIEKKKIGYYLTNIKNKWIYFDLEILKKINTSLFFNKKEINFINNNFTFIKEKKIDKEKVVKFSIYFKYIRTLWLLLESYCIKYNDNKQLNIYCSDLTKNKNNNEWFYFDYGLRKDNLFKSIRRFFAESYESKLAKEILNEYIIYKGLYTTENKIKLLSIWHRNELEYLFYYKNKTFDIWNIISSFLNKNNLNNDTNIEISIKDYRQIVLWISEILFWQKWYNLNNFVKVEDWKIIDYPFCNSIDDENTKEFDKCKKYCELLYKILKKEKDWENVDRLYYAFYMKYIKPIKIFEWFWNKKWLFPYFKEATIIPEISNWRYPGQCVHYIVLNVDKKKLYWWNAENWCSVAERKWYKVIYNIEEAKRNISPWDIIVWDHYKNWINNWIGHIAMVSNIWINDWKINKVQVQEFNTSCWNTNLWIWFLKNKFISVWLDPSKYYMAWCIYYYNVKNINPNNLEWWRWWNDVMPFKCIIKVPDSDRITVEKFKKIIDKYNNK